MVWERLARTEVQGISTALEDLQLGRCKMAGLEHGGEDRPRIHSWSKPRPLAARRLPFRQTWRRPRKATSLAQR